uniref:Uncharacterized protein n=1 Tax=Rangifer tarandus platyrhynchus TaxID=3082113 RepID=A0ACB0E581_RANTA|nr:unnamed protein product [Rangifer tarandus platyrhynchus]
MPVRTCGCNLPGREMPPKALAERSRVQRITLGAVFSGRAVLLLVCAIASTLGVLLCPFSRATGLGDCRAKSAGKRRARLAPPARCWLLSLGHLAEARPSCCGQRHPLETAAPGGSPKLKLDLAHRGGRAVIRPDT